MASPSTKNPVGLSNGQRALIGVGVGVGIVLVAATFAVYLQPRPPKEDLKAEAERYLRTHKGAPLSTPLAEMLADPDLYPVPTQEHPLVGKPAPNFRLRDHTGRLVDFEATRDGKPAVLVFYLGYFCDHCVAQLFALDEDRHFFEELGASIVAVSPDVPETTREKFEEYGAFGFPTLSDPRHDAAAMYGVYDPGTGERDPYLLHGTFVIDGEGIVRWANLGEIPFLHDKTLLHELAELREGSASEAPASTE